MKIFKVSREATQGLDMSASQKYPRISDMVMPQRGACLPLSMLILLQGPPRSGYGAQ